MIRPHAHPDHPSRAVGLIVFLGGIIMLALVFSIAYHLFTQPVPGLGLSIPPQGAPPPAASIGLSLANFLEKLLLLALLTIVGSVVAGKGIHLCFTAAHGPQPIPADASTDSTSRSSPIALTVATAAEKSAPEKSA